MLTISLFVIGTLAGSFLVASVWRLRADQLAHHYTRSEAKEYQRLVKKSKLSQSHSSSDRSRCLDCGYQLRWYDLIPVISWLSLGGKCRQCRRPIGYLELLGELAVGSLFAGSYLIWQNWGWLASWSGLVSFILWLICLMVLVVLFIYDLKWMLLPSSTLYLAIGCGLVFAIWINWSGLVNYSVTSYLGAILILAGLYAILSKLSYRGQTIVGDGDAWLGLALALILGDYRLAAVALFLANFIGVLAVLPSLLNQKITWGRRIPLGPLLIVGALISFALRQLIIANWLFI